MSAVLEYRVSQQRYQIAGERVLLIEFRLQETFLICVISAVHYVFYTNSSFCGVFYVVDNQL